VLCRLIGLLYEHTRLLSRPNRHPPNGSASSATQDDDGTLDRPTRCRDIVKAGAASPAQVCLGSGPAAPARSCVGSERSLRAGSDISEHL
jgi:hypothetical protein